MESMPQVGQATFNPDSKYDIFRNVKEFGAKGDGKTDDTAAIVRALYYQFIWPGRIANGD